MLEATIIVLVLIILGTLAYLYSLDGNYQVKRTKTVNTDIETAFNKVRNFETWADWSPWLMHEPETKLKFSENCDQEGGYYTWDGQSIGAGTLRHEKFDPPHRIDQRLEFTRPFKSVCEVGFEFDEHGGRTDITWSMQGKMPLLFRFMTKKTADMIAKDYDLGLAMLAGQLDPNTEHPRIKFEGEINLSPVFSLCKWFSGGLSEMESTMKTEFPALVAHIEQNQGQITGAPFTAYHKVNTETMHFECDMAIPVEENINPGEYQTRQLGGGRFYKVTLLGSYQFLELVWYAANAHIRMLKLKYDKNRPSLEVYENDPNQQDSSNDIQTTLCIPIK